MSVPGALVNTAINLGLGTLSNLINVVLSNQISTISVDATFEEKGTDLLQITDHPVEAGASISDHSFFRPAELTMHCGWSNANAFFATSLGANQVFAGGSLIKTDYVSNIYSQLLALQQSLQPFTVVTTIRSYKNMLMTSLTITRDQKTSQALMVTVSMRQIIIVNTASASVTPAANQKFPASTSSLVNYGAQALVNNPVPSPQGSLPPTLWGPL
jgi:hypothetical protein